MKNGRVKENIFRFTGTLSEIAACQIYKTGQLILILAAIFDRVQLETSIWCYSLLRSDPSTNIKFSDTPNITLFANLYIFKS